MTEDTTNQSKSVVTQTPQKVIIPKKKIKMGFNHIPTYEGAKKDTGLCVRNFGMLWTSQTKIRRWHNLVLPFDIVL